VVPPVVTPPPAPPVVTPPDSDGDAAPKRLPPVVPLSADAEALFAAELADIALGRRPAAEADLGRASAGAGAAPNVFRKRYRIAQNRDATLCAPGDVASAEAGKPGDKDARSCPAGQ
jgi:hypothetical protein